MGAAVVVVDLNRLLVAVEVAELGSLMGRRGVLQEEDAALTGRELFELHALVMAIGLYEMKKVATELG